MDYHKAVVKHINKLGTEADESYTELRFPKIDGELMVTNLAPKDAYVEDKEGSTLLVTSVTQQSNMTMDYSGARVKVVTKIGMVRGAPPAFKPKIFTVNPAQYTVVFYKKDSVQPYYIATCGK